MVVDKYKCAICITVVMIFVASLFLTGKIHESNMEHAEAVQLYTAACALAWICALASLAAGCFFVYSNQL
jgi:hypothetical protein